MTDLTAPERTLLARGLKEFDAASRRRRRRRRVATVIASGLGLAAAVAAATLLLDPSRPPLPEYVEIIPDDAQLSAELALANACERFERQDVRLLVVECAVPPAGLHRW